MIDPLFRERLSPLLFTPLARTLSTFTTLPLLFTLAALTLGLAASATLLYAPLLAILLLWASGLFDILDGEVARLHKKTSDIGAVIDIFSDRLVEASFVLGLFLIQPETRGLGALLMLSSILLCVTSFLVVGIFSTNDSTKSFHYSPGLMERFEAFLFFTLMALLPSHFLSLALLFSTLTLYTALRRIYEFAKRSHW